MFNSITTNSQQLLPFVFIALATLVWGGFIINFLLSRWLSRIDEGFAKLGFITRFLTAKKYLKTTGKITELPTNLSFLMRVDKLLNLLFAALFALCFVSIAINVTNS